MDELEQFIEKLEERVEQLEDKILLMEKDKRRYTQSEVFDSKVTFRKPVYDKSGNKVIN